MTPGAEPNSTGTAARPLLLTIFEETEAERKGAGTWRGRLPGVTQVKAARLLVTAPHAHLTHVPKTVCFCLSGGGGVRLRALSDELSDNEFEPHGARA